MPACHAGDRRFESGRVRHHSHFPTPRPPARTGRSSARTAGRGPPTVTSVKLRPVNRRPIPVVLALLVASLVAVLAAGQLGVRRWGARRDLLCGRRDRAAYADGRGDRRAQRQRGADARAHGDPDPDADRLDRGRPDRPGHAFPRHRARPRHGRSSWRSLPARARATRRSSSLRTRPMRSSRPSTSLGPPWRRAWSWRPTNRGWQPTSPGTGRAWRSCAPTRSGPRFGRSTGRATPCSASTASRTSGNGR